jgi:hypothetical protein
MKTNHHTDNIIFNYCYLNLSINIANKDLDQIETKKDLINNYFCLVYCGIPNTLIEPRAIQLYNITELKTYGLYTQRTVRYSINLENQKSLSMNQEHCIEYDFFDKYYIFSVFSSSLSPLPLDIMTLCIYGEDLKFSFIHKANLKKLPQTWLKNKMELFFPQNEVAT